MKTTLNQIKANHPCADGYRKLLKFLNKTEADDESLALSTIFEGNGLDDTVWCFRAVSGFDKEKRMFAIFCARQVQHLMTDPISITAIDVAERYANGNATVEELKAACAAAFSAAYSDADYSAANAAANNTAYSTAYSAAAYYTTYSDSILADLGIIPALESYLKNMLSETEK